MNNNISVEDIIYAEIEYDNAEEAFMEFRKTGLTNHHCLKCCGEFLFHDVGNAYKIWCKNNDFEVTVRGF
jgi:hypothetical protein